MEAYEYIDEIVKQYSDELDIIKVITPINLKEENEKFLYKINKGEFYNPQYIYGDVDINCVEEKLNSLSFDKSIISKIYNEYKTYILKSIELMKSIGDSDKFTNISISLFGKPSISLMKNAVNILEENESVIDDDKKFDALYLKNVFNKNLSENKLDWEVAVLDVMSSKVAVDTEKKIVYINKNVRFSDNDIKRLLVHEIGTHVKRAENGSKQKYSIFQYGFPKSIETEEGLATYNERINGVLDKNTMKIYAGRVIAVDLCLNNSFYDAFMQLNKHFSCDECIRLISRVKRGLTNTEEKGGFTKDFVYLNGYYKVSEKINSQIESILYTGVIGLENINQVSELIEQGEISKF